MLKNRKENSYTIQARRLRSTGKYKLMRLQFLQKNPICASCEKNGLVVGASELDHIIPIFKGGDFFDENNLQGLCTPCHEKKTASEFKKEILDDAEWSDYIRRKYQ